MSRVHKLLGGALMAALSLATAEVSGDPATADKKALCAGQPGGLPSTVTQWTEGARLFGGLGDFHRAVNTHSPEAQAYFDQGMRLLWAFNHDEATGSFTKAAQLDPQCTMCWWGVALTVGPNYNLPMMAEPRAAVAWDALQQAEKNAGQASPVEQALVGALARPYPNTQPLDPSNEGPILAAYAQAMKAVAERFPDDTDVQARIALAENKGYEAVGRLREAVAKEGGLAYSEPADWFFPTRPLLGAVMISAGKPADAEAVYRDDLSRHPNNGWALYGLAQSLKLQGRSIEASKAQQQFEVAWKNADVTLVASAY